jgi:uncharacterized membrane protein
MRKTLLLLLLATAGLSQAQQHYRVTNLGTLPTDSITVGYGLNDLGDVVGYCERGGFVGTIRPFVYHAGVLKDFAPSVYFSYTTAIATGINNKGTIVGYFFGKPPVPEGENPLDLAFVYNGTFKAITDGHHGSTFAAISNLNGLAVGAYTPEDLRTVNNLLVYDQAFSFANNPAPGQYGILTNLYLLLPGAHSTVDDSYANAINNKNQIAGTTYLVGVADFYRPRAWLASGGTVQYLVHDINNVNVNWSAQGINDSGQIVGVTGPFQGLNSVAILYQNGKLFPLQTASGQQSSANAINNAGQIVGNYGVPGAQTAIIWLGSRAFDLNKLVASPGIKLTNAVAINQKGQILANGTLNGATRAFLLTPQ